jgi:hypothetical protein
VTVFTSDREIFNCPLTCRANLREDGCALDDLIVLLPCQEGSCLSFEEEDCLPLCPLYQPVPDDPNPTMEKSEVYTRWDITTIRSQTDIDAGLAYLRMETNDDNDDGCPDPGPITVWENNVTMVTALEMSGGKSHLGGYGQPVDVYLDGKKV